MILMNFINGNVGLPSKGRRTTKCKTLSESLFAKYQRIIEEDQFSSISEPVHVSLYFI